MSTRITISYKELLRVAVVLPYYAGAQKPQALADLELVPDDGTRELLRRMDLVLRPTVDGCILLARVGGTTAGGDDLLRFPAGKGDKITLLMRLNNPHLFNMYDLPVQLDATKLFYLSNAVHHAGAARNDLSISTAEPGISGNSDQLTFAKTTYRYHHSMPVDADTVTVRHLLTGGELASQSCINTPTGADLLFDLSSLPGGRCELWIDGVKEDHFYHLADDSPRPTFGVIELSLDAALGANYRVLEADRSITPQRPRYVVRFISRKTYWRYTFRLQPNSPLAAEISALSTSGRAAFLAQLNILTNDATITFAADPASTEQELIFVSGSKLALQDAYQTISGAALSLALTKHTGDAALKAPVKQWLPLPSPATINARALPNIYADIFITI